jgi:hypothetical protein
MKLRWRQLKEPDGKPVADHFYATVLGVSVGSVYKTHSPILKEAWNWSFYAHDLGEFARGTNGGIEPSKQAAADKVRERYECYLTTSTEQGGGMGLEPEEFGCGSSVERLRAMKLHDPEAFWKRIADIRAGKVDRDFYRWVNDKSPLHEVTEEDY